MQVTKTCLYYRGRVSIHAAGMKLLRNGPGNRLYPTAVGDAGCPVMLLLGPNTCLSALAVAEVREFRAVCSCGGAGSRIYVSLCESTTRWAAVSEVLPSS